MVWCSTGTARCTTTATTTGPWTAARGSTTTPPSPPLAVSTSLASTPLARAARPLSSRWAFRRSYVVLKFAGRGHYGLCNVHKATQGKEFSNSTPPWREDSVNQCLWMFLHSGFHSLWKYVRWDFTCQTTNNYLCCIITSFYLSTTILLRSVIQVKFRLRLYH